MRTLIIIGFAAILMGAQAEKSPLDYRDLDHHVSISRVRAGNHDPSGTNTYYFTVTPFAFVNESEDRQKPMAERRHVAGAAQQLGDVTVATLGIWTGEAPLDVLVSGDELRRLTSDAMRQFAISEDKVALFVTVRLFEKAKRFGFWGEDLQVAENGYYVLGETAPRRSDRKNTELLLTDALGTYVPFQVVYSDGAKGTKAH